MIKNIVQQGFKAMGYQVSKVRKYNFGFERPLCWPGQNQIADTQFEVDEKFHELYEEAQTRTQMKDTDHPIRRQRHYTLNYLLWGANLAAGDVGELGCRRGLSAYQIAKHLKTFRPAVPFHIFDSFEGLSELKQVDIAKDRKQNLDDLRKEYACPEETVKANLSEFNFIKYYKGWIPTRFEEVADRKFSFVHIDVDLYEPILESLKFFYQRMIPRGVIVLDDYGCMQFPGAKKAVDEFLIQQINYFFMPLPSGQAFIMKDVY